MNCSACTAPARMQVHGFDLCAKHAHGMMTAVLIGDVTPVGYIIAAACDDGAPVSHREKHSHVYPTTATRGIWRCVECGRVLPAPFRAAFLSHGALHDAEPTPGPSTKSGRPGPLHAHNWVEHRTVKVADQKWREVNR